MFHLSLLHTILIPGVSNFFRCSSAKCLNCWILLSNILLHFSCFKNWNMLMTCTPRSKKAFLLHGMKSFHVRISTETTVSSVLTNQAENIIREHNPGQCFSSPSFPQSPRNLLHPLSTHTQFHDLLLGMKRGSRDFKFFQAPWFCLNRCEC